MSECTIHTFDQNTGQQTQTKVFIGTVDEAVDELCYYLEDKG